MELNLTLDPNTKMPLHRQLYDQLRTAILTGRLRPTEKLPSSRALAKSLGISRTTVVESYDQLLSEGYLETRPGAGTFVGAQLPDDLLQPDQTVAPSQDNTVAVRLSKYGQRLTHARPLRSPKLADHISFRYGQPAWDQFPISLWRRLLTRHCQLNPALLNYAEDAMGHKPLRVAIAQYLARARAVQCTADQIMIVGGSQQALDLTTRLLVNAGDGVAIENPGYLGARHTFSSQGARLYPIPVDAMGLNMKALEDLASLRSATRPWPERPAADSQAACTEDTSSPIKLVYVTPSHQFPTGATLSLPRRLALLAWAYRNGVMVIEDDYDSEYRYGDRPISSLQGLDPHQCVIYVGTFSKVLFPSMRLGYVVLPPALVPSFHQAKWLIDRHVPLLEQCALTDFIQAGHLDRHIRRMRHRYDHQRQVLVQALQTHLGDRVTIMGENAGIHLMAQLHTSLPDSIILQRAAAAGVGLTSAQPYYLQESSHEPPQGQFIFGYAELSEAQIEAGIRRLAAVLEHA